MFIFYKITSSDLLSYAVFSVVLYVFFIAIDKIKKTLSSSYKYPKLVESNSFLKGNFDEFKSDPEGTLLKWSKKHKDICTIRFFSKKIVLLNSYEQVQKFYAGRNGSHIANKTKSYFAKLVSRGYKGILFRHYDKDLVVLRKALMDFLNEVNKCMIEDEVYYKFINFSHDIESKVKNGTKEAVINDIKSDFEKLLVDMMGPLMFGKSLDFDKLRGEILEGVLFNLRNTTMFNVVTMLPIWKLVPNSLFNKVVRNAKRMQEYTHDLVVKYNSEWEERVKNGTVKEYEPRDLINFLLSERYKDDSKQILQNLDDITVSVSSIFLSFFESVSSILTWFVFYLAKHPECQEKCREEIERVVGNNKPCLKERNDLVYFNNCMKEMLRCANQVPIVFHATDTDLSIDEYYLPKGTLVMANLYSILMNEKMYPNPYQFNPDRWLDKQNKQLEQKFIPFSIGKRYCIGKFITKDITYLLLSSFIQRFRFSISDEVKNLSDKDARVFGLTRTVIPFKTTVEII